MAWCSTFLFIAVALCDTPTPSSANVVLVTGASGQTGSLIYKRLKQLRGNTNQVRALVQNVTKARLALGCDKCDASEGIYVGDVTNTSTLEPAMNGVTQLVIAVGVGEGTTNKTLMQTVEWFGVINQVSVFANKSINPAAAKGLSSLKVVLCSSMGTTHPNPSRFEGGPVLFYKLQAEVFLGSAGVQTAVVKPCGLVNSQPPNSGKLIVGHNDEILSQGYTVLRSDVARMMVASLDWISTNSNSNLRMDLCSVKGDSPPDSQLPSIVEQSLWPWV